MPEVKTRTTQKKKGEDLVDLSTWLTRIEVSDLLGVSIQTILNLERRGKLHPRKLIRADSGGAERLVNVYDPKEVARVPKHDRLKSVREPGETAALVFDLLDHGKNVREIVIELRETPEKVLELREKWFDAGGAYRVVSPTAWEQLEALVGPFSSIAELVDSVAALKKAA